jgi:hypothetical protein
MDKVKVVIEKLRAKEGNSRNEAISCENKAALLRIQEMAYRDAWQSLQGAVEADEQTKEQQPTPNNAQVVYAPR